MLHVGDLGRTCTRLLPAFLHSYVRVRIGDLFGSLHRSDLLRSLLHVVRYDRALEQFRVSVSKPLGDQPGYALGLCGIWCADAAHRS